MNLRPPRAQQWLPPAASFATRRRTRSGSHPRPRYTLSHPPYHPATLLLPVRTISKKEFCPIFGVNLRILPIPGACRHPSATPPLHRDLAAAGLNPACARQYEDCNGQAVVVTL